MWMFGSRTTVKKVRNSLTWFSQIREVTELEAVYNRNWTTADWGDSRDVESSLRQTLCQACGGVCARLPACPGVMLAKKRRAM